MRIPNETPFWSRVKNLLRTRKITQKQLAGFADTSYSTIKFWICYGYSPDVDTACKIADALGVSVEYLVKGEKNKHIKKEELKSLAIKKSDADIKKLALRIEKTFLVDDMKT